MRLKWFLENFINKFLRDETTTLAASLAFYTALSLAPLLILFVTIAAQFGPELQNTFLTQITGIVGADASAAVKMIIDGAKNREDLHSVASFFGILTLLLSASLIFGELRSALNRIFDAHPEEHPGEKFYQIAWRGVHERVLHIGFALSFIFVLIVSLAASSMISAGFHSEQKLIASLVNIFVSFLFYVLLFTLMYRYLPDRRQSVRRALRGGSLTAVLFVIGKEFIGLYLGSSAIGSAYGAAGSLIVLLVWVYYSTLITFVGAQVSSLLPSRRRTV